MTLLQWFVQGRVRIAPPSGESVSVAERNHPRRVSGVRVMRLPLWMVAACLIATGTIGPARAQDCEVDESDCSLALTYLMTMSDAVTSTRIVPGPVTPLAFGERVDLRMEMTIAGIGTIDVTGCTRFYITSDNPDGCLEQLGPTCFRVRSDTPGRCIGAEIFLLGSFSAGAESVAAQACVVVSGFDPGPGIFFARNLSRLFPADCLLKTVTITPTIIDPSLAGSTIQLISVKSNAPPGDFAGIQPEFVIIDATSTPASPEIVVQLRACVLPGPKRRIYTLTFKVTRPDGVMGLATVIIDVPVCCRPRGLF